MANYVRLWKCACCGENVTYDSVADSLTCRCGVVPKVVERGLMNVARDLANFTFKWSDVQGAVQ